MYQQQQQLHRYIADGYSRDVYKHIIDDGRIGENHVFFDQTFFEANFTGSTLLLGQILSDHILVSYDFGASIQYGSIGDNDDPKMLRLNCYTTLIDDDFDYATELSLQNHWVSVPLDLQQLDTANKHVHGSGAVLVPSLKPEYNQRQIIVFVLGAKNMIISGQAYGQLTAFTEQYDYWQPTK